MISTKPVDTKASVISSAASHSINPSGLNKSPAGGMTRTPPVQSAGQISPTEASNAM
jgi:hypothetical protein